MGRKAVSRKEDPQDSKWPLVTDPLFSEQRQKGTLGIVQPGLMLSVHSCRNGEWRSSQAFASSVSGKLWSLQATSPFAARLLPSTSFTGSQSQLKLHSSDSCFFASSEGLPHMLFPKARYRFTDSESLTLNQRSSPILLTSKGHCQVRLAISVSVCLSIYHLSSCICPYVITSEISYHIGPSEQLHLY